MSRPLLKLSHLAVSYLTRSGRVDAVNDVDLEVREAETVAIVGESGSGKSTTADALVGLLAGNARVDADVLEFEGEDLRGANEKTWRALRGRRIGFVPQDPGASLDPVKTIGSQVTEALTVHGIPKREARARSVEVLDSVGLPDPEYYSSLFPHQLSGGLRQRVLIGIALAGKPSLVVADEPTSALDVTVQRQVLDHFGKLTRETGTAVLLVTHDLGVAADRADRLMVMQSGRVVEAGAADEVFADPQHPYTRKLLAAAPSLNSARLRPAIPASSAVTAPRGAILSATGLVKDFGNRHSAGALAVDNVSFEVPRHGTLGIVGESGSGKSTTARLVLGLEQATAGKVTFRGAGTEFGNGSGSGNGSATAAPSGVAAASATAALSRPAKGNVTSELSVRSLSRGELRDFRRSAQFVYQNPYASLDPRFTIEQIVTEPLRAFRQGDRKARRIRAIELLDEVALPAATLARTPRELSGGQRQRVAIARALALRPELVVLDEPVSALDVSVQAQILQLLTDLQVELGLSYLFISHDLAVVRQISDRVAVMAGGKIVEQGTTAQIFTDPQTEFTARLLGAIPGQQLGDGQKITDQQLAVQQQSNQPVGAH
ncbi:ABC transporter ATP-binding protein [Saxibacter everestensis]|uniref:ABC transporter ATP-binding protein n=1 Tax=Saxibacter everestensis TaxID=2909229 RepID=A0ABY8QQK0_9MICO|nr:ABC transporter ATP-binding protein [Brevibacteriaceae bacterium ZFBP1038]